MSVIDPCCSQRNSAKIRTRSITSFGRRIPLVGAMRGAAGSSHAIATWKRPCTITSTFRVSDGIPP